METVAIKRTMKELRINLGWAALDLSQQAGLTKITVLSAEKGHLVTPKTAKAIADTLSRGYGYSILVTDIEGLNVR